MKCAAIQVIVGCILFFVFPSDGHTGNFFDVSDSGNVGIGTAAAGALLDVARPNTTSNIELIDIRANGFMQTISSGLSNARFNLFNQYTLSAASAQTVTNGSTVHIAGPPTASGAGPATITTGAALRITGGTVANTTSAYGLYVDAPIGAANNYAAVFPTGNVGIGTTSPQNALHVKSSGVQQLVLEGNSSWTQMGMKWSTNNFWTVGIGSSGANNFFILDQNATYRLFIDGSGNVGIGTTGPGYLLDVAGSAHASSFPTSSDIRLKKNIQPLRNVLAKLEAIKGVAFDWNSTYEAMGRATGHREIGLIAQDVEAVFPELVTTWGEQGYRAIDYGRLAGILVEAVKEQQTQIRELKAEIETLKQGKL